MAPASGHRPSGRTCSGAGVTPVFLVLVLVGACVVASVGACAEDAPRRATPVAAPAESHAAADPALGITTDLDGAAPAFGDAVLAELTGDQAAARAAYEHVLASSDVPAALAARAALFLAQMESRAGRTRHALDLVARATALAPADTVITQGAAALQADVVVAAGEGDVRGPRLGTPLTSVPPELAESFAAAERAYGQVHKVRLRILIEALSRSINDKINLTAGVVAKYRGVAERGGLPHIAATYRVGSLYHDLALDLAFAELPPELEARSAEGVRATLRGLAITYLKRAVSEYRACVDASQSADSELWRFAAETDMRRAQDVLRAAGVRI
ncbi:MAG: hypothetical protein H6Q90_1606 [Deltaproteobacteria bacterium]|nr:hypothetical protein [Deltaproteobacteria bacterium]